MAKLRNNARVTLCKSASCKVEDETQAAIAMKLGRNGKNKRRGYQEILSLIGSMKESNVWDGSIRGYFFKGRVDTSLRSAVVSFATSDGWQQTNGARVIKYGTIIRVGKANKRHLLIFGYFRGSPNRAYCSLTIL